MPFTKYFSNKILDHIFSKSVLELFTFEVALFSREPGGLPLTEIRIEGYKRVMVEDGTWERLGNGLIVNSKRITFHQLNGPVMIDAIGLYEYPNGDSVLIWKMLDEPALHEGGNLYIFEWSFEISLR